MSMNTLPIRHELKYFINERQYFVLSGVLDGILNRDPNGDEYNEYHIRSLYFDTVFDTAFHDKMNGVQNRDKFSIPRLLCEQLMAGDPTGLETTRSGLLNDVYREMTVNLLRPVVLVDYVREAYLHPAEEVRITFDKQLRTGLWSKELFDPYVPTIPPLDENLMILEVKYNRVLPSYIRDILNTYCQGALPSAISKYTWCRHFEFPGEE